MSWKRIAGFTFLLLLIPALIGFVSGFTMSDLWQVYGDTYPEASDNARTARRVVIGVLYYVSYLAFLRGQVLRIYSQVIVLFIFVELLAFAVEITVWAKPVDEAIYWLAFFRHVVTTFLAVCTVAIARRMRPNSSFKPTPSARLN